MNICLFFSAFVNLTAALTLCFLQPTKCGQVLILFNALFGGFSLRTWIARMFEYDTESEEVNA